MHSIIILVRRSRACCRSWCALVVVYQELQRHAQGPWEALRSRAALSDLSV